MFLYQIEISNICSLECSYCPHKNQKRNKGYMTFDTFKKCVELFKKCENKGKLYLHNFGEPLLHPDIKDFIKYAASRHVECSFFTNGIDFSGEPFDSSFYESLQKSGLRSIDFSAHKINIEKFKKIIDSKLYIENVFIPYNSKLGNWGGQIGDYIENDLDYKNKPCIFENKKCFVVLWTGEIASCCIDVEGSPRKYYIDDLLNEDYIYEFQKIPLCKSCSAMREDDEIL